MLRLSQIRFNILALKFCSRLALLPVEIDEGTGKLEVCESKNKLFLWKFFVFLQVCHAGYINVRLMQYVSEPNSLKHPKAQFYLHFLCAYISLYMVYWWKETFINSRYEVVALFNESWRHVVRNQGSGRAWSFPALQKLSSQELLIIGLPWMLAGGVLGGVTFVILERDSTQLIYSIIPSGLRNMWVFFGLLLVEVFFILLWVVVMYMGFLLQLIGSEKCLYELNKCLGMCKRGDEKANNDSASQEEELEPTEGATLDGAIQHCKQIQTFLGSFNSIGRSITASVKFMSYMTSVSFIYFSISSLSSFSANPLIALFNWMIGIDAIIALSFMYDKAIVIPELIAACKNKILWNLSAEFKNQKEYAVMKRVVRSIPETGIQVGQFNTLERTSTLIYVDMIATKVAALLVMDL